MKPRLLDLFCGAGGCTAGYQRAGFYVIGVDIKPQPNYCGDEFVRMDALAVLGILNDGLIWRETIETLDAIHASPPCQAYSRAMRHLAAPQPMLIDAVRELLQQTGLPWVIENVEGSPLATASDLFGAHGAMVCGTGLGLRVRRHRLFESSFPLEAPPCDHRRPAMNPHNQRGRDRITAEFGEGDQERPWREAMGVEWMGRYEAREAIPPAYTEHIGHQLRSLIAQEAAA